MNHERHLTVIERPVDGAPLWLATCSCGWAAPKPSITWAAAHDAHERHLIADVRDWTR
jgi:hypothetical protein